MTIILITLAFLYASLMVLASIKSISLSTYPIIFLCNLFGALLVFLYLIDYRFLYLGIVLLFISALLNGRFILKRITFSHVFIRFIFSIVLITLNYFVHHNV